jgi:acyl-coenzyme A synthetase/AMP-(fatty) acid ligase
MERRPGLRAGDRLLAVTTISFDIAGLELYLPLVVGGSVELTSRGEAGDGQYLKEKLEGGEITVMQATPATWRLLVEAGWAGKRAVKILCGGEALPRALGNDLVRRGQSVWNMYGPTETTIWSAVEELAESEGPVLLGEPIANTQLYVLDEAQRLAPIGVAGELFIGGAGVARGYHGRAALTAERFVPNPYVAEAGARMYRTGDLVRRLADGRLEFLGRLDHQVKIRGFRIESGEIESLLRQHQAVRDTVVVAREDANDKRLVAYLVLRPGQTVTTEELRAHVQQGLPDYMIPATFLFLDELPLTASGKVDRRRLPQPNQERPELSETFVAPRTPIEQEVARIWEEVLKVKGVGVYDNFFTLGGHSLLATRVITRVNKSLPIEMPLRAMFEQPTVAGFALAAAQRQAMTLQGPAMQLLGELSEISDEEAQRLLNAEIWHTADDTLDPNQP